MNTKSFFLFTLAASAMILNLSGCKDDDEDFDYTFENCVERVTNFTNIQNGDTISTKEINIGNIEGVVLIKNGINDVEGTNLIYMGTSKENMHKVESGMIQLSPFTCYYLESVPCIIHDEDTIYGEKKELKFYSIPKHELALTADYGDGEIAANIHWKLKYYYENEDSHSNHKYYTYEGSFSSVKVCLTTDVDTIYNNEIKEYAANADSCYITQGGTREKPDYPAYIYRYWKDGKTVMRYESIIYDVNATVCIQIGDESINVKNTIQTILMDKQQFVCDKDLNIYRITKIGNKTWTIDNYIGLHEYDDSNLDNVPSPFYGENEYLHFYAFDRFGESPIKGYHVATNEDWEDLENFYGIIYPSDTLTMDLAKKIAEKDSSLKKYFTTEGAWYELLSSFGWQDDEGNFTTREQGPFNAIPIGIYFERPWYGGGVWYEMYDIIGVYNMVAYLPYGGGAIRIITNNGIAKCKPGSARYGVRFVKD